MSPSNEFITRLSAAVSRHRGHVVVLEDEGATGLLELLATVLRWCPLDRPSSHALLSAPYFGAGSALASPLPENALEATGDALVADRSALAVADRGALAAATGALAAAETPRVSSENSRKK